MATTTKNWMTMLKDNLTLDQLSIPGTHDSGTEKTIFQSGAAHTQNCGILTQLNDGIRFLDIRVKYVIGRSSDPLVIFHGTISCNISFGDVLNDCVTFLKENPKETIIMLMNAASGKGKDVQKYFNVYLDQAKYKDLFYLDPKLTTLGKLRGKVVLFRRFPATGQKLGVDLSAGWEKDKTFDLETPQGVRFKIEDKYKEHKTDKKWKSVKANLEAAKSNPDNGIIYITYNSISSGGHTPYQYAWGGGTGKVNPMMNPALQDYLTDKDNAGTKRFGIIPLDFYNKEKGKKGDNSNTISIINSNPGVKLSS